MDQRSEPTGWVGWIYFAGVMLMITGLLNAFYGLVAIFNDNWVVFGNRANVFLDLTQWGWVHVIIGLLVVLVGIGVIVGNIVARTVGVIVAGLSLVLNFLAMPIYPLWSITIMVVDLLVIWALIAHGREVKA